MRMKIYATLMLSLIATALSTTRLNATESQVSVKRVISNGPHKPPINAPRTGGVPGPTCLPGGVCQ